MNGTTHTNRHSRYMRLFIWEVAAHWLVSTAAIAADGPAKPESVAPHAAQQESGASHLPAVRLDSNYFSREGHRFIPVGANWVPAKAAIELPY